MFSNSNQLLVKEMEAAIEQLRKRELEILDLQKVLRKRVDVLDNFVDEVNICLTTLTKILSLIDVHFI